jgi:prepilin-type processing-associated H-X9-DG protein
VSNNSDYEYLGAGKNSQTGADVILAHEKIRPGARGINMLFGDGHVEYSLLPNAQQMLARQKAAEAAKGQ